jgi:hypothetical protein
MCEVVSLIRSNDSVSVRATSCDDARGLVRYSIMTTRPEMTIAASQATTAVQMIANASEPTTGTSSASVFAPLRITISGTTPTATTPTARISNGNVNMVMSPASRSGSRRRMAAISAYVTDRARRREALPGTMRS